MATNLKEDKVMMDLAYQYNADAFEARGVDEVKQEATHKEVSKVREDKTR